MAEKQELYDVIIFGTDTDGPAFQAVVSQLASLLESDTATLEKKLREPGAEIIRGVTGAQAKAWQKLLLSKNIRCNYRPSNHADSNLELAVEGDFPHLITCPACGHEHPVKARASEPDICEKCGVVFHKFREARRRQLEHDQIKRQVAEKHQISLLDGHRTEATEDERRQQLEAQIRRELGLPPFISSRYWLIFLALSIFILGLMAGAAAVLLANLSIDPYGAWAGPRQYDAPKLLEMPPAGPAHGVRPADKPPKSR